MTKFEGSTKGPILEKMLKDYPNVSIRKIAKATNANYPKLLKASKAPKAGEIYDPNATNFEAIAAVFEEEKVDFITLNWDELNQSSSRGGGALKKDMSQFPIGAQVYLRRNNEVPYTIQYKTAEYIVLQLEGSEELLCWAHQTFLFNGPQSEPRAN